MKLLCNSKELYDSISNSQDKKRYLKKYFSGLANFDNMPLTEVSLWDAKTRHQLGAIWGDWTLVGRLMHTEPETVYYWCLKATELQDCWIEESTYGKSEKKTFKFLTLSGFSKDRIIKTNFISRYRDYLQKIVNNEYGEWIPIKWFKKENMGF